jgi:hypothetical protein
MVAVGICATAHADEVVLGSDYFQTQPGTFATLPLLGTVDFVSVPFGGPLGLTDTIVERTQNVPLIPGASGSTNLMITALSLVSTNLSTPLYVSLDPTNLANDTGVMSIEGSTSGGSFAVSYLDVYFDICTAPGVNGVGCGTGTTVYSGEFVLSSSGTWSPTPPPAPPGYTTAIVSGPVGDQAADWNTNLTDGEVDFWPAGGTPASPGGPVVESGFFDGFTENHVIIVAPAPEPNTLLLLGIGLATIGSRMRKRQSRKA